MVNNLRVGIPIVGGKSWLGGVSHLELHVKAVTTLPSHERPQLFLVITKETLDSYEFYRPFITLFDAVIFMGDNIKTALEQTGLTIIHCKTWDELFSKIDFFFPVSFNVLPGYCSASWIHDFQHKHLPDFFPAHDLALRDQLCSHIASQARLIFCSSKSVERDFRHFYPDSTAITQVLALRIAPEAAWYEGDPLTIQEKYDLPNEFVVCSNQFWVHKNHRLLFKAISLLRQSGKNIHLVCTGLTNDFRCPNYLNQLNQSLKDMKITDLVHILGQIPRHDQIQLIRRSLFVVQPSLFEGLSLIVQECRALGKTIVLSDLDVHLEHEYGIYFERNSPQDLADKIAQLIDSVHPGPDTMREKLARLESAGLTKQYAKEFCKMVETAQTLFGNNLPLACSAPVLLATSLMPSTDHSSQQRAVDSWLQAGFAVVSVNRREDIPFLKLDFPKVTFQSVTSEIKYRDHVTINDLLNVLAISGTRVCGMIESDVCLYGGDNLASYISKEAVNCLAYTEKISIDTIQTFEGTAFPNVGCVFFDRQFTSDYPEDGFCLCNPWWDYWTLVLPIIRKIPVKRITTPLAYHVNHPEQYDIEVMLTNSEKLAEYLPPPFDLSIKTLAKYQHIVAQIIRNHSLTIALHGLSIGKTQNDEG
ncbi:hypothetical protein SDC9_13782 [bioreactor metagenome]|uniref:Glycosyl transferase family 1 domain-containing protein n=1 Tax=bioreactor metagenome TaxID=1076179 RepID=A0A644TN96_9ZZZZ|nr:glycosyltransferase [Negativicutes bacterium]